MLVTFLSPGIPEYINDDDNCSETTVGEVSNDHKIFYCSKCCLKIRQSIEESKLNPIAHCDDCDLCIIGIDTLTYFI